MGDSIAAQEFQNTFEKLSKNFKNVSSNVRKLSSINSEQIKKLLDNELLSITNKMTELGDAINITLTNVDKYTEQNINKLRDEIQSKIQSTNLDNKAKIDNLSRSIEFLLNSPQTGGDKEINKEKKYLKYKVKYLI
tara:strand:+ start:333 stop:740 length:408 start_codon:yes stop_codon:yes gene_type:complete